MSSHTWACFDCRRGVRREATYGSTALEERVVCSECGGQCMHLGSRIPLPPRRDHRAWAELREHLVRARQDRAEEARRREVTRIRRIRDEIARLEERSPNPDRAKLIAQLRESLGDA